MNLVLRFSDERQSWIVVSTQSAMGVLVKSLHLLAVAWIAAVTYLWVVLEPAQRAGAGLFGHAAIPAATLTVMAWSLGRWARSLAPHTYAPAHEWGRALSWSAVPILLLAAATLIVAA